MRPLTRRGRMIVSNASHSTVASSTAPSTPPSRRMATSTTRSARWPAARATEGRLRVSRWRWVATGRRTPACRAAGRNRSTGRCRRRRRRSATGRRAGWGPPSPPPRHHDSRRSSSRRTCARPPPPTGDLPGRDSRGPALRPPAVRRRPRRRAPRVAWQGRPRGPGTRRRRREPGLQGEDPYDPSLARMPGDLRHEIRRPHVRRVIRPDVSREQEPVAADPLVDGHVLLAVAARERDRVPHHARSDFEPPQDLAGPRICRLEPTIERAVERDVARGDDRAAPHGVWFRRLPYLLTGGRIPRDERPHVPASTRVVGSVRADERRSGDASRLGRLVVHAHVFRREVEEPGAW